MARRRRKAGRGKRRLVAVLLALTCVTTRAAAQVTGSASLLFDVLPDVSGEDGRQGASEARARIVVDAHRDAGAHWRFNLAGEVDALLADRGAVVASSATAAAIVNPLDTYVEYVSSRLEVRAGTSRLTWGRLDEFQPTDVVNPLDLARFLLEGRSEARLSVGLVRTRFFATSSTTVEAVVVPFFRASRFDQLEERSSPFNLLNDARGLAPGNAGGFPSGNPSSMVRVEPDAAWSNVQGGLRLMSTAGTVDWGVSAYRGFRTFPIVSLVADGVEPRLVETFPRFTMVGGDFETVRGEWGIRGEIAVFADDERQSTRLARAVSGRSVEGGVGIDRRAGDSRLAANVLWSWWGTDPTDTYAPLVAGDPELERRDVSIVLAADRSFARETRTLRVFAVYDPADATVFARAIGAVSLRDNVWLEGSGGLFAGDALDTIGRLTRRDFVYGRLKVFF
jgi:hypothetical protein